MLLSIANSRPRNMESIGVESLYPPSLRQSVSSLVGFIERYYDYLNTTGLPSNEIANITRDKDIDIVSNKYLTEIQSLIARNIPNSRAIDKVTLYRIIVQYYRTRGSEDSIHTFFKIFFDEIVDIFYPRDYLFELSQGSGKWAPIDIASLREVYTNPNKVTLQITSDYRIGPFPASFQGPYVVTLTAIGKYLWTYAGGEKSFALPYIERINIANEGETPVYRWVYRYKDEVELYSTDDTAWPDEATWSILERNINFSSISDYVSLLESGEYASLENFLPHQLESAISDQALITKNIQYDSAEIIQIAPTVEPEYIVDEFSSIIPISALWTFSPIAATISNFSVTTSGSVTTEIAWDDSTPNTIAQSGNDYSHSYVLPIVPSPVIVPPTDSAIGNTLINEALTVDAITTEKIILLGDSDIDISIFGLTTEDDNDDYLINQRGLPPEKNTIVTEDAVAPEKFLTIVNSKNVEYYHIFDVISFPQYTTRVGELVHSLEDVADPKFNTNFFSSKVYRSADLDPITWVEIDKNSNVWTYVDSKSFASDLYKLHDGEYWQKYSYRIRCQLPQEEWINDYLRFVHPAGLKLFSAILYEFVSRTGWTTPIDYTAKKPQDSYRWINRYDPPVIGYHSPRYQPGWLSGNERLISVILEYLKSRGSEDDFSRLVLLFVRVFAESKNFRDKSVYEDYQGWIKYLDPNELICGYSDRTLDEAITPWADRKKNLFSNISSFVTFKIRDDSYYPWYYSELIPLDPIYEDTDPNYFEAKILSFDSEFSDYNNSTLLEKEPLSYRHALEAQNEDDFTSENSNAFITEGQTHPRTVSALFSNKTSGKEKEIIRFYALTKYIPEGTTLYWSVSEPNVYPQYGTCVVKNEVAIFRVIPLKDFTSGESLSFKATIRQGSQSGPILAHSETVEISDNTQIPTYSISSNAISTIEGGGITFTLTSVGVADNTSLYYVVSRPEDISPYIGGVIIKDSTASFTIIANPDIFNSLNLEGNEYFNVKVYSCGSSSLPVAESESIEIKDAYSLWSFTDQSATIIDFTVTTSDASTVQIGWTDGSLAQTVDSDEKASHTYT